MSYVFTKSDINPDALEQNKVWYDRTGREYDITKMHSQHCIGAETKLILRFGGKVVHKPLYKALEKQRLSRK